MEFMLGWSWNRARASVEFVLNLPWNTHARYF
jgi:hypothetical protein